MVSIALIAIPLIIAVIAIGLVAAWEGGALDSLKGPILAYIFKAEAKAEEKKLEAEGETMGEDFLKSELPGNEKAGDTVKEFGLDTGKLGLDPSKLGL